MTDQAWFWIAVAVSPIVGSFLGLAAVRLPQRRPVVMGRSACDACGRTLQPFELIPIASFIVLKGRCRTCGSAIPRGHLAMEALSLAAAVWAGFVHPGPMTMISAVLAWQLLLLSALDIRSLWLPRMLTIPLIVTGLAVSGARGLIVAGMLGAAVGFAAMALLAWGYRRLRGREGLGGGDAYLLAGAGAWIGWIGLPSVLLIASGAGVAAALLARLAGKPVAADQPIPFGAFIAFGAWIVWLYGPIGLY